MLMKEHPVPELSQRFLLEEAKTVCTFFAKTRKKSCDFFCLNIEKLMYKRKKRKNLGTSFVMKSKILRDKKEKREKCDDFFCRKSGEKFVTTFVSPAQEFLKSE